MFKSVILFFLLVACTWILSFKYKLYEPSCMAGRTSEGAMSKKETRENNKMHLHTSNTTENYRYHLHSMELAWNYAFHCNIHFCD